MDETDHSQAKTTTDQCKSPLQSLLISLQFSLLHIVSLPAQSLCVGLEFPKAVDGLDRVMPELRLAIEPHEVAD